MSDLVGNARASGLTLVEMVLAIGIVTVALLSLIAMFTQGLFVLSHSKQIYQATELAQQCLENVSANGGALVSLGTYDSRLGDLQDATTGFPPSPYRVSPTEYPLVVQATTTGAPTGTVAVQVEVYYEENRKISLQTYLNI